MAQSERIAQYQPLIDKYAKQYNVDPALITAIIQHESGFDPNAKNSKSSATGLGQMTLATAKDLGFKPEDRLNPEKSIEMVAKNLNQKLAAFGGDTSKAILAYNQGIGGANQILKGTAKEDMAKAGNDYLNSPIFSQWVNPSKQTANPVSNLPTQAPALQGGALLQAKPQTDQQALQQATGSADMGAQTMQDQQLIQEQRAKTLQDLQAKEEEDKQDRLKTEHEKRQRAYETAAYGLMSLLGSRNQGSTTVQQSIPGGYNSGWGAPTESVLRQLSAYGSPSAFNNSGRGF